MPPQATDVTFDYLALNTTISELAVHASDGMCVTMAGLNELQRLTRLSKLLLRVEGHASLNNPRQLAIHRMQQLVRQPRTLEIEIDIAVCTKQATSSMTWHKHRPVVTPSGWIDG